MTQKIIFDADLTMGVPDCDVDDGLALLYALGHKADRPGSVDILGLCTSYGNSVLEVVHENAKRVLADLAPEIPLLKGASDKDHPASDAAQFIVDQANAYPHEISLCVTGSTTNLKGAIALDADVLSKLDKVVCMGGITQTLVFNGKIMNELNFSCDPQATTMMFASANNGASITVITANNCLPAHFMPDEFERRLKTSAEDGGYLYRTCAPWFDTMKRWYGLEGFCCWDVLASAYILEPHLFTDETFDVVLDPKMLGVGFLEPSFPGAPSARITVPRIRDAKEFCKRAYELWNAGIR